MGTLEEEQRGEGWEAGGEDWAWEDDVMLRLELLLLVCFSVYLRCVSTGTPLSFNRQGLSVVFCDLLYLIRVVIECSFKSVFDPFRVI